MDIKKLINIKNSREWTKANDSTNSKKYRDAFVQKYGGCFVKKGSIWLWNEKTEEKEQPTKLWLFYRQDGVAFTVENFMEFCRNHNLNKSAMYDVMNGKRKSHKGFTKVEKLI